LGQYPNIEGRYTRLEKQVLPHDEWVSQNELSNIARDVTEDDES
jgi:hypothetical protein